MESLLPENKVKIPIQTRVEAYNLMNELKEQNISKTEIVNIINNRFKILQDHLDSPAEHDQLSQYFLQINLFLT